MSHCTVRLQILFPHMKKKKKKKGSIVCVRVRIKLYA